jgi:cell wall-associated NlpC family hydrolase
MNRPCHFDWLLAAAFGLLTGCSLSDGAPNPALPDPSPILPALNQLKAKYAPDSHMGVYSVGLESQAPNLVLTGEVDSAQARLDTLAAIERAGLKVTDRLNLLPTKDLGERVWGIACLSVASGREQPEHKAEMGTQELMGAVVRVLKPGTNSLWYYAQSSDGYLAWFERGTFVRCTREQVDAWSHAALLVVTAFEDSIREAPQPESQPVSDVVVADLVKKIGEADGWFKVELPDGRAGFLPKTSAEDYAVWQQNRRPTAENIERTAKLFLGRPYLWGGNSPKGLDCSGFTKLVFYLNGLDLPRNAAQQAHTGREVSPTAELSGLKKGDLIFFGSPARDGRPERVHHVGVYLGDKLFIHSSERVQINSLDPNSPIRDEHRIRTLFSARRALGD